MKYRVPVGTTDGFLRMQKAIESNYISVDIITVTATFQKSILPCLYLDRKYIFFLKSIN